MKPIAPEEDDFISRVPDNVVTNILDRLPLCDAVRTGILSKTWRFKWTMLSQLVFDDEFFSYLSNTNAKDKQVRVIISRFLFHLRGAITKFYLLVDNDDIEDEDISHWILFLSRKGIKDLTIQFFGTRTFKLPTHFFSCLELKHLELFNCFFYPPPSFLGFPNLLSLDLDSDYDYGELITQCPLLEILILRCPISCEAKVAEIAKLENLKILSLCLFDLDTMNNFHSFSPTFELLGSLPKLQELELIFNHCKVTDGGAKHRFSTAFPSLKTLKLSRICLDDGMKLSRAFELIRSCPNLQTLEITQCYPHVGQSSQIDYNTTGQLHLRSVMFELQNVSENEMFLLKYILACSPFLKMIVIRHPYIMTSDEKLKFAMKLLKLHRASPDVDVDVDLF